MRWLLLPVLMLLSAGQVVAQQVDHFRVQPSTLIVTGADDDTLHAAFAGGMNACQLGEIDLNLDGSPDLIVFDRHGNRIIPFLHSGTRYSYSPEYSRFFPDLKEWVQIRDYNQDGKADLFTYTTGGIKVFRNDSEDTLSFTQVSYPYLVSLQGSTLTNILVTYADYPAIQDIDNDGDLDILTFWGLGSFVEWHKNSSIERYGTADSLVFEKATACWGHFAEAGESNIIHLDTCVTRGSFNNLDDPKHTGSTLLVHDLNADQLPDLVLGDVDFSSLVALLNGGTLEEASMVSQEDAYPDADHPVDLVSFPAAGFIDANHDGLQDLWVSPFDPSLVKSDFSASCWLYTGTVEGLNFQQSNFLQDEMIDLGAGAYPLLMDVDMDGLPDLIVGNYGVLDSSWYTPATGRQCEYLSTLTLFRNTGSLQQPAFHLENSDYLGLSALKMQSLIPAAGDLDGDGDTDLICGNSKGKLVYLENIAEPGQAPQFAKADPAFRQIDAGDFSAPQIIDLDQDGWSDLVIGKRNGTMSYYRNTGQGTFELITELLGGVDVTNTGLSYYGYLVPFFYRNEQDELLLLAGSEFGEVFVYSGISPEPQATFTFDGFLAGLNDGWRSSVAIGHLAQDTITHVFVGNYSGGLGYYQGMEVSANNLSGSSGLVDKLRITPNPGSYQVRIDPGILFQGREAILEIIDFSGKRRSRFTVAALPCDLPVSDLSGGIYLVRVLTDSHILTGKLIISR